MSALRQALAHSLIEEALAKIGACQQIRREQASLEDVMAALGQIRAEIDADDRQPG